MRVRGHADLGAVAGTELLALERSALGRDDGASLLEDVEGREVFQPDRAGVGTPLGDLGTPDMLGG